MYSFLQFLPSFNIKNKYTRYIRTQQVLNNQRFNTVLYMRDDKLPTNSAKIKLPPKKGTQLLCRIEKHYFESYGFATTKISLEYIKKLGDCIYSENQI